MSRAFEVAGGSVMGREHYRLMSNRQDAYYVVRQGDVTVAVVCDGCGDPGSPQSEVGAALGARMIANRLGELLAAGPDDRLATIEAAEKTLEQVRRNTLAGMKRTARSMGGDLLGTTRDCFLFTVVGCAMNASKAVFFSIGDGVIIVNGQATLLGPYPGNAPPYMAYALLDGYSEQADLRFKVHHHLHLDCLNSFLIGSDGVEDMIGESITLPGTGEAFGGLEELWNRELHYVNPQALSNRLRLLNTEQTKVDWQAHRKTTDRGRLPDDTTVIVGRRRA